MSAVLELSPAQRCLDLGERDGLARLAVFELHGPSGAPLVLVQGGISSDSHVCASELDARAGWWDALVGPGRALDTRRVRVLSLDWIARARTLAEQVDATVAVLDALGVERCAALGASLGGSLALELAARHPQRVSTLCAIAAAHRPHARTVLARALQRDALELGRRAGDERAGLELARALALSSYAGARGLERGFASRPNVAIASWARGHARAWASGAAAAAWSERAELLDAVSVDPARVRAAALLVGFDGDELVPIALQDELARALGARVERLVVATDEGHDAFLRDTQSFAPRVAAWCEEWRETWREQRHGSLAEHGARAEVRP